MTFAFRCWTTNPPSAPCDVEWSADPVAVLGASFAVALIGLGFFALVYLLATRKGSA